MTPSRDPVRSFEASYGHIPGPRAQGRRVVGVLFPGVELLDCAGPAEVFHLANLAANQRSPGAGYQYDLELLSLDGARTVVTTAGIELSVQGRAGDDTGAIDTLLVPGGVISDVVADRDAVSIVGGLASRARRVASVCSGAFVLGAAGLLAGKRATTHWRGCRLLAERFPDTRVEVDPIFVADGNVYTSAGSSAGIDLALHLVEEDLGVEVALHVSRDMVLFLKRPGGQAQFSRTLESQGTQHLEIRALLAWLPEHLQEDLRVERLAERSNMSVRNFVLRFPKEVGTT
ncbi:MAG: DJ-1/PfpI family protein, partial [Holophagales bacterium]|nr:DJ-1/PfpI family protein [Holophagales bacterium]